MNNSYRDIVEALFGRKFKYTTISMLKKEGLSIGPEQSDDITEDRAIFLINTFSNYINALTAQWFEPFKLTFSVKARDQNIFYLPNKIPIIKVDSISYTTNSSTTELSSGVYRINKRYIELKNKKSYSNLSNYLINGVFGFLENVKFLETTLDGDVDLTTDTTAKLDNIAPENLGVVISNLQSNRFCIGDVVIFQDSNENEICRRIIVNVDYSTNTITFDKFTSSEIFDTIIPDGTIVKTYGRVPMLIETVCIQFVIDNYLKRATNEFSMAQLKRRIKSEKTDNYSYDTFSAISGGFALPDPSLTSDPILNRALAEYSQPGYIIAV